MGVETELPLLYERLVPGENGDKDRTKDQSTPGPETSTDGKTLGATRGATRSAGLVVSSTITMGSDSGLRRPSP